jgi:hypothetical protein
VSAHAPVTGIVTGCSSQVSAGRMQAATLAQARADATLRGDMNTCKDAGMRGRVTAIRTQLLADLKRASEPIAKLMTNNADETGDQL